MRVNFMDYKLCDSKMNFQIDSNCFSCYFVKECQRGDVKMIHEFPTVKI